MGKRGSRLDPWRIKCREQRFEGAGRRGARGDRRRQPAAWWQTRRATGSRPSVGRGARQGEVTAGRVA
jgi:hypothetical protein